MAQYLLGIDNGSTMVKAALFDTAGREIAVSARKFEHVYEHPGWTEVDVDPLWDKTADVISEVIVKSGVAPSDIACVTCTGHGNGLYLVDESGAPSRRGIISSDGRARKYIEEWDAAGVLDRIRPKTMQAIWPAQPNALLRWLMDNEPDTIARTRWMFMVKDLVRFRLTGEAYMELTDMSGCSLIDVGTGEYDDEVLDVWGLFHLKRIMPPLKHSADLCGKVTAEAAAKTGLAEGTPVAGGMFDIDACGLAVGMTNETQLCMVAGTWGNNQYISKTPVVSPDVFMTSCYSIPGYYLMLEGSATSASNLEWLVTQFFQAERDQLESQGMSIFDRCNELVGETAPDATGVIFLPYLYGSPVSLDAKACLFGLDGRHERGDVLRAVYEGIIFGHKWHVERLLQFRDMPETIRLTGGAAKSDVWMQMFADVFQVAVEAPSASELGALGAAICGAVAVGVHPSYDAACEAMVSINRRYEPNTAHADAYRRKYERYVTLLDALAPVWGKLAW